MITNHNSRSYLTTHSRVQTGKATKNKATTTLRKSHPMMKSDSNRLLSQSNIGKQSQVSKRDSSNYIKVSETLLLKYQKLERMRLSYRRRTTDMKEERRERRGQRKISKIERVRKSFMLQFRATMRNRVPQG